MDNILIVTLMKRVIKKIRMYRALNVHLEMQWLTPLGYYENFCNNATSKVRKERLPSNLAFVLVEERMSLLQLHTAFNTTGEFTHQYYLLLPQLH